MKALCIVFTLSYLVFVVKATVDHSKVRRFFRPEHRSMLIDPGTELTALQDQPAPEIPQITNDESTKCLAHCEPQCPKLNIPDYLVENSSFSKFEKEPIDCVLGSTVVFKQKYQCQFLCLYLFDCCRACNAKFEKCRSKNEKKEGGLEYCYRESYHCMCDCLDKHNPPENYKYY